MAWPPRLVESQHRWTFMRRGTPRPSASHTSRRFGNRSGKSVRISAATSPRRPRGRRILARVTPVKVSAGTLFEDFECEALSNFHSCRAEDGAHGFRRASLPANHLAEILGMYAQFKNGHLLAFDRTYLDLFGMIHKRFRNRFYKLLHGALRHSHSRVQLELSLVRIPWASGIFPELPRPPRERELRRFFGHAGSFGRCRLAGHRIRANT